MPGPAIRHTRQVGATDRQPWLGRAWGGSSDRVGRAGAVDEQGALVAGTRRHRGVLDRDAPSGLDLEHDRAGGSRVGRRRDDPARDYAGWNHHFWQSYVADLPIVHVDRRAVAA